MKFRIYIIGFLFIGSSIQAQILFDMNTSSTRLMGHRDGNIRVKDAFNYGFSAGVGWQPSDSFRITLELQYSTRNRIIKNLPINGFNPDGSGFLERAVLKNYYYSANLFISNRIRDVKNGRLDIVAGHYFQYYQLGSRNSNHPPKGYILNGLGKDKNGKLIKFSGTEVIQNAVSLGVAYEKKLNRKSLRFRASSTILFVYWPMSSKQGRFVLDEFHRPQEEQYYHQTTSVFAAELKLGLIYYYLRK